MTYIKNKISSRIKATYKNHVDDSVQLYKIDLYLSFLYSTLLKKLDELQYVFSYEKI